MSVGVADRRSLHVKISRQSSAEIPAMGHGWLGLLCKAMLAPTWELKALPQSHESWPTFWHGFLSKTVMSLRENPTSSHHLCSAGFLPPTDFVTREIDIILPKQQGKHSNGTSPVYRWCDCELNLHWELPSHIWSEQTQFQGVKGLRREKWEELKLGKAMAGGSSEHDDHLSCRG